MIWENFDKIFLLNLLHRKDRREYALEELAKVGIAPQIWTATYNKENGMLGCVHSYGDLFTYCMDKGYKRVLVFEDDVEWCVEPEWVEKYSEAGYKELPTEWDMFYLGGWRTCQQEGYSKFLKKANGLLSCHAVAYSDRVMKLLATQFTNTKKIVPHVNHNDQYIARVVQQIYKCYLLTPMVACQREDYSDILKRTVWYPMV